MSIKVCMIGCGGFARQAHGPAQRKYAARHADVELAGCCDVDARKAQEFAHAFGYARSHSDIEAMLARENPDAVVAAVPPPFTCRVGRIVLERGLPVLLEKPPGLNPAELRELIAAERQGGGRAQVAFNRHYMPLMRRALAILDASFPRDEVCRVEYDMIRHNRWNEDFSTTAVHAIDGALLLARNPPRAAELRFDPRRQGGREATDVVIDAECASGPRVRINIHPVFGRNLDTARVQAIGQSLQLRLPVAPQSTEPDGLEHWRGDQRVASFEETDGDIVERLGVFGETAAFLEAVRSGAPLTPRLEDCHPHVVLMEAIRLRRTGPIVF